MLSLVLNAIVHWNTLYVGAALERLQVDGTPIEPRDITRLSPLGYKHINILRPLRLRHAGGGRRRPPATPATARFQLHRADPNRSMRSIAKEVGGAFETARAHIRSL